jgi:hypothetical protein
MAVFDDLFGSVSGSASLPAAVERHILRRAQRLAERGVQPPGVAGMRARAADQAELAREISEALQAHDLAHAQALIHEGAAVFGHAAMVRAVEAQARQERTEAMGAVDSYHREVDPWADDREPYGLEDERSEDERW